MFNRSLDALYLFSRNISQNARKSGSTSKYETDCFHNFHELPQTPDNKLPRYIVNETDNKQAQIHGAKKDKKVRTLKINGTRSKHEAKQNKGTDTNFKKTTTDGKNKSVPRKILILGDSIVKEIDG